MLVIVALAAAALINVFLLPNSTVAAAPFAVAVVLAARQMRPQAVHLVTGASIVVLLLVAIIADTAFSLLIWNVLGLGLTGYIAGIISAERQHAREVQQKIVASNEDLQRFLSLVAHDMGQPITTINGYAQVLSRSREEQRTMGEQQAVEGIEGATHRLRRLTDDLRDAGAVGTHHFTVQREDMELVALLRQVVEQQQASTDRHRIELTAPDEIHGHWDAGRLYQLFANLISNAIKYSPDEEPIRVDAYRLNGDVVVTVSDTGIGMSHQEQRLLFKPFSRVDTQSGGGTGLGLFISKGIVDAHGGEIWVASQPNSGSTFSVRLPVRPGETAERLSPRRHPARINRGRRRARIVDVAPGTPPLEAIVDPSLEADADPKPSDDQPVLS